MVAKEPYLWSQWDERGRAIHPKLAVFVFSAAVLNELDMTNFACTETVRKLVNLKMITQSEIDNLCAEISFTMRNLLTKMERIVGIFHKCFGLWFVNYVFPINQNCFCYILTSIYPDI